MIAYRLFFQIVLPLAGVNSAKFRFWDIGADLGVTYNDFCAIFGESNMEKIFPGIVCDNISPCDDDTKIPGVTCSGGGNITSSSNSSRKITSIDFSDNDLDGYLPAKINELQYLVSLDLSNNNFKGIIPRSFASGLMELENLYLHGNKLSGAVPATFCNLPSLKYVSVGYSGFVCYDSCYDSLPNLKTDFMDKLSACSDLLDLFFPTSTVFGAYRTCSHPQLPTDVSTWTNRDFCTFSGYPKASSVEYYSDVPDCLKETPWIYCQTFSFFSYACGAEASLTIADVDQLSSDCIAAFNKKSATLAMITLPFSFYLYDICIAEAQYMLSDPVAKAVQEMLILTALSKTTTLPISSMKMTYTEPIPEHGDLYIEASVTMSAESLGFDVNGVADAEKLMSELLLEAMRPSNGSESQFSKQLKRVAEMSKMDIEYNDGNFTDSLSYNSSCGIGNSFIKTTTTNSVPTFFISTIEYMRTLSPTLAPDYVVTPTAMPSSPALTPLDDHCLRFELLDLFGDGWDTAHLLVLSNTGDHHSYAPSCSENPLVITYCFDLNKNNDGDYTILKIGGYSPSRPWEVLWKVTNGYNGRAYRGDISTVMIFVFKEKESIPHDHSHHGPDNWVELYHALNIVSSSDPVCDTCLKPQPVSPPLIGHPGHRLLAKMSATDDDTKRIDLDLSYKTYDIVGNVYGPPRFFISMDNALIASGFMCNTGTPDCRVSMPDGDYTFRVSDSLEGSDLLVWTYCGVSGKLGYELKFRMDDGQCTAKSIETTLGTCLKTETEIGATSSLADAPVRLHVHGVVALHGSSDPVMSSDEAILVKQAIAQEFNDAHLVTGGVTEAETQVRPLSADEAAKTPSRRLNLLMASPKQVAFQVTMKLPKIEEIELKSYLEASMTSGLFITRIRSLSQNAGQELLKDVTRVSLLDLHISHESLENEEMSIIASAVIVMCAVAAGIFGILFYTTYNQKRSLSYSLVRGVEMDGSSSTLNSDPSIQRVSI
mmetsp:Transcript_5296/g.5441  ORF Transcript_5296/g.5441 Transcript_5296/m.5441 type:complete len:993 (+) Transcript_5296:102-3080(+)|eukprot:CAMPEP_0182417858 /NCGR_PEP_ID=MMETSP1167-20130531/2298_1 /TAXON_ID=2988 /ORGANISM="Mallomonas Sp, Strain CCMP3275" /LENGTH=992 /DNA_ID=CAMNT_0024591667 /DNA_START=57 /DNA_END=3035 /DNA_ORIENTATION=-